MKLLDGSWFTRISYADGLSTIIPYAPIRSDSGQEQAVYYLSRVLQGPELFADREDVLIALLCSNQAPTLLPFHNSVGNCSNGPD